MPLKEWLPFGWYGFILLAAICVAYGLFIEKNSKARVACISVGVISAVVATALDLFYRAWSVPW